MVDFAEVQLDPDYRQILAQQLFQQSVQPRGAGLAGGLTNFATGFGAGFLGSQLSGERRQQDQTVRDITAAILRGENPDISQLDPRTARQVAPILLRRQEAQQAQQARAQERELDREYRQQDRADQLALRREQFGFERDLAQQRLNQERALAQLRLQQPNEFAQRAAAAVQFGLDPNSDQGRQFILTGKTGEGRDNPLGNSYRANLLNTLLTLAQQGQTNTPQYRAYFNEYAAPRTEVQADGTLVTIRPDTSAIPAPGAPPQAPTPQVQVDRSNAGPTAAGREKLQSARDDANQILTGLNRLSELVGESSLGDRASAAAGGLTPGGARLNTAFNVSALLAKGEALLNLGVLNGPDLDIIRRALTDPGTASGIFRGPETQQAQIREIQELLQRRIGEYEQRLGQNLPGPRIENSQGGGSLLQPAARAQQPQVLRFDAQGNIVQ